VNINDGAIEEAAVAGGAAIGANSLSENEDIEAEGQDTIVIEETTILNNNENNEEG